MPTFFRPCAVRADQDRLLSRPSRRRSSPAIFRTQLVVSLPRIQSSRRPRAALPGCVKMQNLLAQNLRGEETRSADRSDGRPDTAPRLPGARAQNCACAAASSPSAGHRWNTRDEFREIVQNACDTVRSAPAACGLFRSWSTLLKTAIAGAPAFFTRSIACGSSVGERLQSDRSETAQRRTIRGGRANGVHHALVQERGRLVNPRGVDENDLRIMARVTTPWIEGCPRGLRLRRPTIGQLGCPATAHSTASTCQR